MPIYSLLHVSSLAVFKVTSIFEIRKDLIRSNTSLFISMGVVAVAGGSGAVGRTIVEAFISHGKHEVIVLSRTVRRPSLSHVNLKHLN